MKITKNRLTEIIKEELDNMLGEEWEMTPSGPQFREPAKHVGSKKPEPQGREAPKTDIEKKIDHIEAQLNGLYKNPNNYEQDRDTEFRLTPILQKLKAASKG